MSKKTHTVTELRRRARSFAGGNVQNLEFPHDGFSDVHADDWDIVMDEFEKIAQRLYKSARINEDFVK